jgi:hypothetical protein
MAVPSFRFPERLHVTPCGGLCKPFTVAVNCCVLPLWTFVIDGLILTELARGISTVTISEVAEGFTNEIALRIRLDAVSFGQMKRTLSALTTVLLL